MDLRPYGLTAEQEAEAARLLNYQPFRISDRIVTGVPHSWLYEPTLERINRPQLVFDAGCDPPETWERARAASEMLTRSYERFLDAIVTAAPGGSYLDIGCNSGWFPVSASLRGMQRCLGVEPGDFSPQIAFLNRVTGASAIHHPAAFEAVAHNFVPAISEQFDVVSCMALLIHVPEPLHLLRALADRARRAVFLWSAFPRSETMFVRYPALHQFSEQPFPWGFDAGVAVSDALLCYGMAELGFREYREITPPADGWPEVSGNPLMAPYEPLRGFLFLRSK